MSASDESGKLRPVSLQVQVSKATIAAIDDYRFATRAANRAEAVRRLLKVGQAQETSRQRFD